MIAIILCLFIAIQTSLVQNWLVGIATKKLSAELGTEVSIKHVSISLFNKLNLEGALVRDKQKDTLLYAGTLKVRITDWFFLKDKVELKYIGLEDAVVKLQRRDSVWNYQFIADYFSSPSPKKKKGSIDLNLKKLDLKNITFLQNDEWRGERIFVKASSILLDADNINFNKKAFSINEIIINKPYFSLQQMDELRPDSLKPKGTSIDTGLQMNVGNIALRVKTLTIHGGTLAIDTDEDQPLNHFDGSHIHVTKINGTFLNTLLKKDTLISDIELSAKERSGLELKRLKAIYKVTPELMEFSKMDMQTNKSRIGDYYAMKYKHFNDDFGDYISMVKMNGRLKDAKISSDDVAYFAPELKDWKTETIINGNGAGTVEDFKVDNLFARVGSATFITGNFAMKGIPDMNKTNIAFNNGVIKTNHEDVSIFVPALKNLKEPNLSALGEVIFRGNFNGTINNFKTTGTLSTNIGGCSTDIAMQIPSRSEATYTGSLSLNHFNIGKFLDYQQLGFTDFMGEISGKNFDVNKLTTTIEGNFNKLDFNGYTYSNIVTNGTFQKKYFNGEVKIDDPNLNFTSQIEIDLSKDLPRFNILGDLVKSNLKSLNFLKKEIV